MTRPSPHWRVWKVASALDEDKSSSLFLTCSKKGREERQHPSSASSSSLPSSPRQHMIQFLAAEAASILREWGYRWGDNPGFQSLLNKSSLLHEVEESIIAIDALLEWSEINAQRLDEKESLPTTTTKNEEECNHDNTGGDDKHEKFLTIIDLCCGKGVFSMLLSHLAARPDIDKSPCSILLRRHVERIVMIDKATRKRINWDHIDSVNSDIQTHSVTMTTTHQKCVSTSAAALPIDIREGCNIHDETFLPELESIPGTLAIVGIHLCKTLGTRCAGLFNQLGPAKVKFLCLAPCCLPRLIRKEQSILITVALYETKEERTKRVSALQLRDRALGSKNCVVQCYLCGSLEHRARGCCLLSNQSMEEEERILLLKTRYASMSPCWRCGMVGHQKSECKTVQSSCKPSLLPPPMVSIDVSKVISSSDPFGTYCSLLTDTIQIMADDGYKVIRETNLIGGGSHEGNNWNGARKSKYIIVTR